MNTKCFINTDIYRHNNIFDKIIGACQFFSFKTFDLSVDCVAL